MRTRRQLWSISFFVFVAAASFGCSNASRPADLASAPARKPAIVFMTDFGSANDAVAICKAVIVGISEL